MFKRSRRKIIASIMVPFVLLFIISLCAILLSSYHGLQQDHSDLLERYTQTYSLEKQPTQTDGMNFKNPDGKENGRPQREIRNYELSTFYSVAIGDDGTVLAVDNGNKSLYTEDELNTLAQELLAEEKASGKSGDLTYQIIDRDGYTLIAFMDNTVSDSSWNTLLQNFLIIGCASIVIVFFFSLWLSGRIIRPLEENDRRQKQFISDASHELKTPVAAISANAELLSRDLGKNDWLDNIQYENERMGGLVKQLLNLSRAENAETLMAPLDFSRLTTGEELALESVAFEQGKIILSEIGENITVTGNEQQLTQLVSILLDNAIRYSTGPEIRLSLTQQNRSAVLSVSNPCVEIPPEKLSHLFDRFYRADEARSGDDLHYGLGLSIAKAIAEKHQGKISIKYADGAISFTVILPQKSNPEKVKK